MTNIEFQGGRIKSKEDSRDFTFDEVSAGKTVTVPSVFGHGNSFSNWGMLGNDKYGDCVWAGGGHETMLIDNLAAGGVTGQEVAKFSTENTLKDYGSTGFNPVTGANDNGTEPRAAFEYRINPGLLDASGNRHKIAAYVKLNVANLKQLAEAVYIFDAVGAGFEFPGSAMQQFNENKIWSIQQGAQIEGGHYVPIVGKPAEGYLTCITWGKRQILTENFYKKYFDEAYAFITEESLNKLSKKNWGGFGWAELQERLKAA